MFPAVNFCAIALTIKRPRFGKLTHHKFPHGNYQTLLKWRLAQTNVAIRIENLRQSKFFATRCLNLMCLHEILHTLIAS
jgi:hypothetical protein